MVILFIDLFIKVALSPCPDENCSGLYQHEDAFRDDLVFTIPSLCVGAFGMKTSKKIYKKKKTFRKAAISAVV